MRATAIRLPLLVLLALPHAAPADAEQPRGGPVTADELADAVEVYPFRHRTVQGVGYVATHYSEWWRERVAAGDDVAAGYYFDPTDFLLFAFAIDRTDVKWDLTVRAEETSGFNPLLPTSGSVGKKPNAREQRIAVAWPWGHSYYDGETLVSQRSHNMTTRVSRPDPRGFLGGSMTKVLRHMGIRALPGEIELLRGLEVVGEETVSDVVTHRLRLSVEHGQGEPFLRSQFDIWVAADGCPMRTTSITWLTKGAILVDTLIVRERGIVPTVSDLYRYSYSDDPNQPTPYAWSMRFGFKDLAFDDDVNWEQRSLIPCIGAQFNDNIWTEMPWDIYVLDDIHKLHQAGTIAAPGPDHELFPATTKREFESLL
ncbi:MAG TPA: hypothetical protein QGH10_09495 [Armatimonadota bacterium]|nr:hypothetical protein [Armatimonadota bacterium]